MVNSKILIISGAPIRVIFQNSVTYTVLSMNINKVAKYISLYAFLTALSCIELNAKFLLLSVCFSICNTESGEPMDVLLMTFQCVHAIPQPCMLL